MARLFLSHSSRDNPAAIALRDWLAEHGYDDIFLDIDPARGLVAGERWQAALKAAADRCEAVLFLISPAWLHSRWCLAEFLLAKTLHKRIFGLIIAPVQLSDLPAEMTAEWQLCDLVGTGPMRGFLVSHEDQDHHITFTEGGLGMLRHGLERAGLDARSFPWPPPGEPNRAPYRGLKAVDTQDAAVFFGRDADIVRGIDQIRGLAETGLSGMLIILAASGAGKSSFLRAGLWPRLARDDAAFLPLPVVRPEAAAVSGPSGLAAALAATFTRFGTPRAPGDIKARLRAPDGFAALLAELRAASARRLAIGGKNGAEPLLILPLDQAEELLLPEGAAEAEQLLTLVAPLVRPSLPRAERMLLVATIRSDRFESWQALPQLAGTRHDVLSLPPMPPGEFKSVIEGPARRAKDAGGGLTVEPALTARLMAESQGADALSLLGFTLERLYQDFGATGTLTAAQYDALGGIGGILDQAVGAAVARPEQPPAIPTEAPAQAKLLRASVIPWLARIDPDTGTPQRRVATLVDMPAETRPLVQRLVEARLLLADHRGGADVVEVAHESLLRTWPMLKRWLAEDAAALAVLEAVARAAADWNANQRREAWLNHRGTRLEEAEHMLARADFAAHLGVAGRDYVAACSARELALDAERREAEAERQKAATDRWKASRRLLRRTQLGLAVAVLLMLVSGSLGWLALDLAQSMAAALDVSNANHARMVLRESLARMDTDPAGAMSILVPPIRDGSLTALPELTASSITHLIQQPSKLVLAGHAAGVIDADFSPDGTRIVTASSDDTARVWDARTGRSLVILKGHKNTVFSARFSPDGRRIVTASWDNTARVWDAATGRSLAILEGHKGWIYSATFSPDSARIVTASEDKTARLWDAKTGLILATLEGHTDSVWSATFSADGTRIVTTSDDHTARVWDGRTGQSVIKLQGHTDPVRAAAFSPDGSRIVTAALDNMARVWDARTGASMLVLRGHGRGVSSAVFSPDGKRIVTASDDYTARVWDAATGQQLAGLAEHSNIVLSAAFSPDGTRVVTASSDQTARVWDAQTGRRIAILQGHTNWVVRATFSPDGAQIVTASPDDTARVWDVQNGNSLAVLKGHTDALFDARFSPDGTRLVTASADNTARVWNPKTGQAVTTLRGHESPLNTAAFSPDGARIVTASDDKTARLWDAKSGQALATLRGHTASLWSATFSPDGTRIATASADGTARVWDARTGQTLAILKGHAKAVYVARFSHDSEKIVTASMDNTAIVWNALTGQSLATLTGHAGAVHSAAFSPDGARIVTASDDHTVRVWDARSGQPLLNLRGHANRVFSAEFNPDGSRIVTASADRTALVWDAYTGHRLASLQGHQNFVVSAKFSPDSSCVVTASADRTARIWDVRTGQTIAILPGHDNWVLAASLSEDGTRVVTASADRTARIWDLPACAGHTPSSADVRDLVNLRAPVTSRSDDQGPRKTETLPLPLDGDAAAVQRAAEAAEAANPPDLPAALTNWARAERLYDAAGKIAERDHAAIQRFNLGNAVPQDVALRAWRAAQPTDQTPWYRKLVERLTAAPAIDSAEKPRTGTSHLN